MNDKQWIDQSQPQTLYLACMLLYMNLVFTILFNTGQLLSILGIFVVIGGAVGAYFIANEKKWGYFLAIGASATRVALYVLLYLSVRDTISGPNNLMFLITMAFPVLTVVLLLHKMSRDYVKIWFR